MVQGFTVTFWNPYAIPFPSETPLQRALYSDAYDFRNRIEEVKCEITADVTVLHPVHKNYMEDMEQLIPPGYSMMVVKMHESYNWVVIYNEQLVTLGKTHKAFYCGEGDAMICSICINRQTYILAAVNSPSDGAAETIYSEITAFRRCCSYKATHSAKVIIGGTWRSNVARDANVRELISGPNAFKIAECDAPFIAPYGYGQKEQDTTAQQYLQHIRAAGSYYRAMPNHILCSKEIVCYSCPPSWQMPTRDEYAKLVTAKKMPWASFSAPVKVRIMG